MTGGQGCIYSVYCVYLLSFLCSRNQFISLKSQDEMLLNPAGVSRKLKSMFLLKISSDPRGGESSERTAKPQQIRAGPQGPRSMADEGVKGVMMVDSPPHQPKKEKTVPFQ